MKRALILSLYLIAGSHAPFAEAQSVDLCEGEYAGTYSGDFMGSATGFLTIGNPDICGPTLPNHLSLVFFGALAQAWNADPSQTSVGFSMCVHQDLSFFQVHNFLVISGTVDLINCTVNGTWTVDSPAISGIRTGGFTLNLASLPPAEITWTALNGDFGNTTNWDPEEVPGTGQTAVFNQNSSYAVSFGNHSSRGFRIEQGNVTFLTGAYSVTGGSENAPSAIVGTEPGGNVFLSLSSHNLTTIYSTFAPDPETRAGVTVKDNSNWIEQNRMSIGQKGNAILQIQDSASVTSLETLIGVDASGEGQVLVTPQFPSKGAVAEWTTGSIAVGLRGKGTVEHRGGSIQSHTIVIGAETGSMGMVKVGAAGNTAIWEFNGNLHVGDAGNGEMEIVAGGFVTSTSAEIVSVGGLGSGGVGTMSVEGQGSEFSAGSSNLGVGIFDRGLVILRDQARLACDVNLIGSSGSILVSNSNWICRQFLTSPSATIVLNNGTLTVADILNIGSNVRLLGTGSIVAPNANVTGVVMPGAVNIPLPPKGLPEEGGPIGTLTFGGNVDFGSATLVIEVAGIAEGNFDVIHATGAVDIQNSTVVFTFIDGFLPRTGDIVPFLIADGGVMIANLVLEFEGVADGFQFEVTEENGMLVFEALSDAQPDPNACHGADLNRDGVIDFFDLLNFIGQMNGQRK
jgi:T5SS/PEP-CTERM-associated repeat protein